MLEQGVFLSAYEYDIKCCFPRIILNVLGYDYPQLKHFINDKQKRSRILGIIFRVNPQLSKVVRQIASDIIDDYISQIGEEHVLLRKTDGFISTKQLLNQTCSLLDIEERYCYTPFVINGNAYVGLHNDTCIVKGIRDQSIGLSRWWSDILQNLDPIFIRGKIVEYFTTTDMSLFAIPVNDEYMFYINNGQRIFVKDYNHILIEPDRKFYFQLHVLPLLRPVLLDTIQK